ncbi:unnamed protein product, partial [marine sediment metagenome]
MRSSVVKPYFARMGADPMAQNPLPDVNNLKPHDFKKPLLHI